MAESNLGRIIGVYKILRIRQDDDLGLEVWDISYDKDSILWIETELSDSDLVVVLGCVVRNLPTLAVSIQHAVKFAELACSSGLQLNRLLDLPLYDPAKTYAKAEEICGQVKFKPELWTRFNELFNWFMDFWIHYKENISHPLWKYYHDLGCRAEGTVQNHLNTIKIKEEDVIFDQLPAVNMLGSLEDTS